MTPDQRCPSSSDDTWIFSSDGTFEYDHGTVTEDETQECSDLVNLLGTWTLSGDNTLQVVATQEKGNPSNTFQTTLLVGTVTEITKDKLTVLGEDGSTSYTFEFRKR